MRTTRIFKFIATIEVVIEGEIPDEEIPDGEIVEAICDNIDTGGNLIAIGDDTYAYVEDIHMEWLPE